MRIIFSFIGILLLLFASCDIKGVEQTEKEDKETISTDLSLEKSSNVELKDTLQQSKIKEIKIDKASDTLRLENGIVITYFNKGTGKKLQKGDVVKIDYRAKLEDGTVYDGNHLINKPTIPFLVGWKQQTTGWDLAMEHLRVGDDVDIFLPAEFARGKDGIKGIVPPNANNILSLRIVELFLPIKEGDGISIWKYDEWENPGDSIGFQDEVQINYWASAESNPRYDNSYQRGEPFKLVMGDGNIVPGLYKALYFGREGDRLLVKIPPEEAYGTKGLQNLVKPNDTIFYDLQIANLKKKKEN